MNNKIVITLAIVFLTACMDKADTPQQVAEKFWNAVKTNDTTTARQLVSKDTQQSLDNYLALPPEQKTSIGSVSLDDEKSTITTVIQPEGETLEDDRTFETVLVLENGQWKIDASRTEPPPPKTDTEKNLEELASNLSESLKKNQESMDDALTESMKMLNEALREGSHEMGESLLKGMNKMNEALRESVDKMKERRQQLPPPPVDQGTGEGAI